MEPARSVRAAFQRDMSKFSTPHLEKIQKTLVNDKLPAVDKARLEAALKVYGEWIAKLDAVVGSPEERLEKMVTLLNDYRLYVDLDLIFDSPSDFLYRQKGQLKLDNSICEEFLPRLITPALIPEIASMEVRVGPAACYSSAYFMSSLDAPQPGGGLAIKEKAQDFAISKPVFLRASHSLTFAEVAAQQTSLAYIAAECKTNLDKTMFQEASATARETKAAVTGARYYLLAEWLDMTPLSTAATEIDEVLLLRGAKRLNSNIRKNFDTAAKRTAQRSSYVEHLLAHPLRKDVFLRFINHVRKVITNEVPIEEDVLERGYF